MNARRAFLAAIALALPAAIACGAPQSSGPVPGQDPIVGKWHHTAIGTTTFTPEGTFLPDDRFAAKCRDVPQVQEEKAKCASGTWSHSADGSYAVVMPNFKQIGADGASDCKCHSPIHVTGRLQGDTLEIGHEDGRPSAKFERR